MEKTMFTVYAITNNKVISKKEVEQDMVNFAKDVMSALTNCELITVMRSNGSIVSQEHVN